MPKSDEDEAVRAPRKQQPVKSLTNCLKKTIDRLCKRSKKLSQKYSRATFQKAYPGRVFPNEMRTIFITWEPSGDCRERRKDALIELLIYPGWHVL
jgi:hypothetical protein